MSGLALTDPRSMGGIVDDLLDDFPEVVVDDRDWVDTEFDALIAAVWPDDTTAGDDLGRRHHPAPDRPGRPRRQRLRVRGNEHSIDGSDPRGRERAPPHDADVPLDRSRGAVAN